MLNLVLALRLIFAHVLLDATLTRVIQWRQMKPNPRLLIHIHLVGGLLRAAVVYVLAGRWTAVWILPIAWAIHAAIETLIPRDRETIWRFVLRQIAYLTLLFGIWVGLSGVGLGHIAHLFAAAVGGRAFWIVAVAFVVVVWPAGQLVGLFTEPWRKRIEGVSRQGLANAGLWIGRLERVLVLLAVLTGRYELVGFLVAAKSILRFADIRGSEARQEAEYILVGTMMSFALAIVIGIVARLLL